ncbi:energy transducer TonB [Hymenobacter armeniacus]|uniref:Energy transducer TonB n=1 Tax=Hymenobacter armeniacus TaxID=2771358 RepID=A0ABR8JRK2_9BACT|nr:energy transducer TonB [Hymenobacter armeniacus]MBD2721240.1 energy transducer TonB [Hymenobacter armeniacus]
MKTTSIWWGCLLGLLPLVGHAQVAEGAPEAVPAPEPPVVAPAPPPAPPQPPAVFYAADFTPSTSADSLAYCAETTFRDSVSGVTRVYYPSGRLMQYLPYADVNRRVLYGTLTTWYEDGSMKTKEDYVRGVRHGELLTYYPDGAPKRRDQYVNGKCGVGSCYAPNGTLVPYFAYEQLPLYPGGGEQLVKELSKAIKLNKEETAAMYRLNQRVMWYQGNFRREVKVELAVAPNGRVTDARVVQGTDEFLKTAALRAVPQLKRQFLPGRRDGQPTASLLTVPIYYDVMMNRQSPFPQRGYPMYRTR